MTITWLLRQDWNHHGHLTHPHSFLYRFMVNVSVIFECLCSTIYFYLMDHHLNRLWNEELKDAQRKSRRPRLRNALIKFLGLHYLMLGALNLMEVMTWIWNILWITSKLHTIHLSGLFLVCFSIIPHALTIFNNLMVWAPFIGRKKLENEILEARSFRSLCHARRSKQKRDYF